jgi:hypothetical protein
MGGVVFQQTAVIPVAPNCVPLHGTCFFGQTFIKYKDDGVPQVIWEQVSFLLSQKMVCYYNLYSSLV